MIGVGDVISRLGGADQAARALGVGTEAIRKWRQFGAIPTRHWQRIMHVTGLAYGDLPSGAATATGQPATVRPEGATAALVLNDGSVFWGVGFGAHADGVAAELCFCTAMTGYQETLTDPSYARQIITFTTPHIGNVGANPDDMEAAWVAARGVVVRQAVGAPSSWRAVQGLDAWLRECQVPGIAGIDTRALTRRIRDGRPPHAVLAYPAGPGLDVTALAAMAAAWPGLDGMDLAEGVSCKEAYAWEEMRWDWAGHNTHGFARQTAPTHHVVAVDYGAKRNILRSLAGAGCRVTVVPARSTAEQILAYRPDGVFLSNGPGDPAATARYAVPAIRGVMEVGVPIFGICLGHQLLAHALGGRTRKMAMGHRGANQPVREIATGKVEITSQNHGFEVDADSLPRTVRTTHVSLFDGSNEGIACPERRCFSVQYHPEASPGPSDSHHLFERFVALMNEPR